MKDIGGLVPIKREQLNEEQQEILSQSVSPVAGLGNRRMVWVIDDFAEYLTGGSASLGSAHV